jgi:hypothetical protein
VIAEMRAVVVHHLAGAPWPVHEYLPDDVGGLPCIGVPGVDLLPNQTTSALVDGTVTVLVVGSRITTDEAAAELDAVADVVVARFGNVARPVRFEDPAVSSITVEQAARTTVTIGGAEYPAYAITLVGALTPDC